MITPDGYQYLKEKLERISIGEKLQKAVRELKKLDQPQKKKPKSIIKVRTECT
jgi:hypothetical protein